MIHPFDDEFTLLTVDLGVQFGEMDLELQQEYVCVHLLELCGDSVQALTGQRQMGGGKMLMTQEALKWQHLATPQSKRAIEFVEQHLDRPTSLADRLRSDARQFAKRLILAWEEEPVTCSLPRGDGVVGPNWSIVARNVLNLDEQKFFLSNASAGVPLSVVAHMPLSRRSVEHCLQDEKTELGLSHFETRGYPAIQRNLLITQLIHLFLVRETRRLRGGESRSDFASSPRLDQRTDQSPASVLSRLSPLAAMNRRQLVSLATSQSTSPNQPAETSTSRARFRIRHTPSNPEMPTRMGRVNRGLLC